MARSTAIVTCLVVAAWLVAPLPVGRADESIPDTDGIAFSANSDVFLVEVGNGVPFNLTAHPASDHSPVWSPIGSRVGFVSDRDGAQTLSVLGAGGVVAIAPAESLDWSWSPDGKTIAWVSHSAWKDLWVTDVTSGASSNLTNGTMEVWGPSWSPDSTLIAFESSGDAGSKDIFTMPRSGGSAVNLTGGSPGNDLNPVWSPNGTQIAFVSQRDGTSAIYLMSADGGNPQRLVTAPDGGGCPSSLGSLAWSPDGSQIAYKAQFLCGMPVTQGADYYVVGRSGGTPTFLTYGNTFRGDGPVWSPDGTKLAVVSGGWSHQDIIVVGADGRDTVNLSSYFSCTNSPSWSPDGSRLAFAVPSECGVQASPPPPPSDVYVIDFDGGAPTWVAAGRGPTWRPPAVDVGLVDSAQGLWMLRGSRFFYGNPGDSPFVGDWDCNGTDTPGLYRQSDGFAYLRNSNTQGIADMKFYFGNPGDVPLAGDFNGDGCDTVSIYRPSEARFYVINQLGENEGGLGAAEYSFLFGNPGDKPVVGDWDRDGIDEIGLHRESTGLFYYRNTLTTGVADGEFYFGDPGDYFIAGDWGIQDGVDTPAVFRPSDVTFYFRHTLTQGNADYQFPWRGAHSRWLPVAGDFGLD
jgi:Tol biopolymer transport system component